MVDYNFLKHNESDFPHVDNIDVYKFDNKLDYNRYNAPQMDLMICTVPWDMGEAHIGNRTISGIGNVVYFESAANRDAWFNAIPDDQCYRFTTKYKELHRDLYIDVPVPFDICAKYNYLVVKYNLFANDNSPLTYEKDYGAKKWFWFIREVEFLAPNTTRLHILDDAFQTWIYDLNISGMILDRGHAPMFAIKADDYLSNPIEKCEYLLAEDINIGEISNVKSSSSFVFNDSDMYACIVTTGNVSGNWTYHTPAASQYTVQGIPSFAVFGMPASELNGFLSRVTSTTPQFKQTIQAVFFASAKLLTIGSSFTFCNTTCYWLNAARKEFNLTTLTKDKFDFDGKYQNIAKLYTYPYSAIEITDENGNVDLIKIEETNGKIDVSASLSIAYPYISIDAQLQGINGSSKTNITFSNINGRSFSFSGRWYEYLKLWNIPTFSIVLDASSEYSYSAHFDNIQRENEYNTTYSNTTASSATERTNTKNSASTNQANENASADVLVRNTAIQTSANSTITSRSNSAALRDANLANALSQATQAWEAGYTRRTANNQVNAQYASAAIGAASGVANSAISGASAGASAGPVGAIAGAVGGLVSGAISGATSMAQTAVAANLTSSQAEASVSVSQSKVNETSRNNNDRTNNQNSANTSNTNTSNSASNGISANSAATQRANASRTASTISANADRSNNTNVANANRDKTLAQNAIINDRNQAGLREPFVFGEFSSGENAVNKPIALFTNIVTQNKSAIKVAADEMLRYGYTFGAQWEFDGNWNVGKYFTYWKLRDFWVSNLNVPDMYMDKIRFFLFGGVTVWRNPEDIGKRTIYENFN